MTSAVVLSFQTFFSASVFALVAVSGRPDGWTALVPTSGAPFGVNFRPSSKLYFNQEIRDDFLSPSIRPKRVSEHHIEECMHMASEEGEFYYKEKIHSEGKVCGIYFFGEPDQVIEITFNYLDVSCENGGLVVVVDGWELNGEIFPNPDDHPKALKSRFNEFCGKKKIKETFVSSQNVALIQHRMPFRGASFSFNVKIVRNPTPCNVLVQLDETYTLRNYDRRSNCSLSSLFPASVRVLALNVGITPTRERGIEFETGTFHKVRTECQKRGLGDYVQIGGSFGLDSSNMKVADSLCGLNSKPGKYSEYIACDTTTVRLVSSGAFDNSVTVSFSRLTENDINNYMSVVCLLDDITLEMK
ncbi:corticotropin-releasing factor-binding protein isoform X1 [Euwallacea similis]|uniref:corticotropin-releasing factor-binding protein isoform X1 n=1 Tax=Euwallacea similis TaxID=1736056 RepID=UPI00344B1B9E